MTPETFIETHIISSLVAEGFLPQVAQGGAREGLDYYRRCSQSSRKGSMFDDCLFRARQWALGQTAAAERHAGKKQSRRKGQSSLF